MVLEHSSSADATENAYSFLGVSQMHLLPFSLYFLKLGTVVLKPCYYNFSLKIKCFLESSNIYWETGGIELLYIFILSKIVRDVWTAVHISLLL